MKAGKVFLSQRVAVINFITGTKTLKAVTESISPTKKKEISFQKGTHPLHLAYPLV